ncbi:MAG TPA: hypothetical protein VNP72_10140 [Longimicrobium sp.]|nr:hypothetical protein [Longimicrobium sp.]
MSAETTGADALGGAFERAVAWAERAGFAGYDPYDGLNTRLGVLRATRPSRLALVYLNKFSPVNLRPLLAIRRHATPAGVAVASRALLRHDPVRFRARAEESLAFVLAKSLRGKYGHHCWNGIDFPIQMGREYQTPDVPGVIGTAACAGLVLECWRAWPERDDLREVLLSVRRFLLEVLLQEYEGATFFRYKPITAPHSCTYNASAVAAGLVARINALCGEPEGGQAVAACFRYLLERQHPEGHWNYSIDLRTGTEKKQVDFHQGYVLEQLMEYLDHAGPDAGVERACAHGLRFYRERQFTADGRALYRWPREWPASISNQAQGIVTFALAARFDDGHRAFARTVAEWTVRNMMDRSGWFYYLKYPFLTYRVPYFRWSQATMIEALQLYLAGQADGRGSTA